MKGAEDIYIYFFVVFNYTTVSIIISTIFIVMIIIHSNKEVQRRACGNIKNKKSKCSDDSHSSAKLEKMC